MLDIRPAEPEDHGAIKVLLAVCLLPGHNIDDRSPHLIVAESERGIIGICAIEHCGDGVALLQSLGVMPGFRKQQIGRRLVQRAVAQAEEKGIDHLFVYTDVAGEYFQNVGFESVPPGEVPAVLHEAPRRFTAGGNGTHLMRRATRAGVAADRADRETHVGQRAMALFDEGYHCAESVLLAAAEHAGIKSPLIPAIATGFSHGTANTWGTCGALNGAILAINLTHGRTNPQQSSSGNYQAVRELIASFGKACGATLCSELMGCDLDTTDGQKSYRDNHMRGHCRQIVGTAAGLAGQLIDRQPSRVKAGARAA